MKRFLSCALLVCALSLSASAGIIHQPGEPVPPDELTLSEYFWAFVDGVWTVIG